MLKWILIILMLLGGQHAKPQASLQGLKISPNGRFFQTKNGKPFFWLGDTGWLLFVKCNREDALFYLDTRKQQGFNVIQVMVIHDLAHAANFYGDSALINRNVARPLVTAGNNFSDKQQYDYWDHIDFIADEASKRGIYLAMVPIWGSNVKDGKVNEAQAEAYAKFLAERYKNRTNIIWLNGGDIKGSDGLNVWNTIGGTLEKYDPTHLLGFHPRGRNSSSEWFHNKSWLDFNMFQSGHRTYSQDTSSNETLHYGEDNWRYMQHDYSLLPFKPSFDGEPSYENIPYGLHDSTQPRWKDHDIRRYAYWSAFAGAAGFTYGENAVMQFHNKGDADANFGVNNNWKITINAPGANQMKWLKSLMLSRAYFDSKPDQSIIVDEGSKYDRLIALKGRNSWMIYNYSGREMKLDLRKIKTSVITATWFDPASGKYIYEGKYRNNGIVTYPGMGKVKQDRVLILAW